MLPWPPGLVRDPLQKENRTTKWRVASVGIRRRTRGYAPGPESPRKRIKRILLFAIGLAETAPAINECSRAIRASRRCSAPLAFGDRKRVCSREKNFAKRVAKKGRVAIFLAAFGQSLSAVGRTGGSCNESLMSGGSHLLSRAAPASSESTFASFTSPVPDSTGMDDTDGGEPDPRFRPVPFGRSAEIPLLTAIAITKRMRLFLSRSLSGGSESL